MSEQSIKKECRARKLPQVREPGNPNPTHLAELKLLSPVIYRKELAPLRPNAKIHASRVVRRNMGDPATPSTRKRFVCGALVSVCFSSPQKS